MKKQTQQTEEARRISLNVIGICLVILFLTSILGLFAMAENSKTKTELHNLKSLNLLVNKSNIGAQYFFEDKKAVFVFALNDTQQAAMANILQNTCIQYNLPNCMGSMDIQVQRRG